MQEFQAKTVFFPDLDSGFTAFTHVGGGSLVPRGENQKTAELQDYPAITISGVSGIIKPNSKLEITTVAWFELLVAGKFNQAANYLENSLLEQLPAEKMQDAWNSVIRLVGLFKDIRRTSVVNKDGFECVHIICGFQKYMLEFIVVYEPEGKISEISFKVV